MDLIGALDIGGTKIAVALVSPQGQVLSAVSMPSQPDQRFEASMESIALRLDEMCSATGCRLAGIGIGSTGQVDSTMGLVLRNAFLPSWTGRDPVHWLADRFGVQAALENDADAAALAEWRLGVGKGTRRMIYLTVGTGIGAGMVFDGQIYRGAGGVHPEVGHHTIDPSGPECFCGNRGCWEVLASGRALQLRMQAVMAGFSGDAAQVCDMAQAGDPWAAEVVARHAQALGVGLSNLITLFAPETIVLGGGLMRRAQLFLPRARSVIFERCRLVPAQNTRLELSALGTDTALVGAAQVWAHHFAGQLS